MRQDAEALTYHFHWFSSLLRPPKRQQQQPQHLRQLQVGRPSAAAPGEGLVFLGIDCAAAMGSRVGGAAGARGNSDFAEGTGGPQRMQSLLVDLMLGPAALDKSKLCILRGKLCYHVYIDCMVLMAGGSLLDALSLSIVAALRTLMLPTVFVETDAEEEQEGDADAADSAVLNVACDEREAAGRPFPAENIPLVVTVGQIGRHYVWDMRSTEEAACSSRLAVAVSPAGFKSVGLQTLGNSLVDPATFSSLVVGEGRPASCVSALCVKVDTAHSGCVESFSPVWTSICGCNGGSSRSSSCMLSWK